MRSLWRTSATAPLRAKGIEFLCCATTATTTDPIRPDNIHVKRAAGAYDDTGSLWKESARASEHISFLARPKSAGDVIGIQEQSQRQQQQQQRQRQQQQLRSAATHAQWARRDPTRSLREQSRAHLRERSGLHLRRSKENSIAQLRLESVAKPISRNGMQQRPTRL